MLTASIPLNTTITQIVQKTATFTTVDNWVNEITSDPNTGPWMIESYRTKEAQAINNSSMLIKQRVLEKYRGDSSANSEKYSSHFYIMINYENRALSLDYLLITIQGILYTQYQAQSYYMEYQTYTNLEQNTAIANYLNNQKYTTYNQYYAVEQMFESLLDNTTPIPISSLDDLTEETLQLHPQTSTNVGVIFAIDIYYDDNAPLPVDEPINLQINYPKEIVYDINFLADSDNATDIVDIPGLMFSILGMPFAWFSQAFNLTIFPGTLYEINLSHVFIAVVASLLLIVIIKKILK